MRDATPLRQNLAEATRDSAPDLSPARCFEVRRLLATLGRAEVELVVGEAPGIAGFLGHSCMKNDLEKKVAQFVPQIGQVAARNRVGDSPSKRASKSKGGSTHKQP